jgi:hypothetical protein
LNWMAYKVSEAHLAAFRPIAWRMERVRHE